MKKDPTEISPLVQVRSELQKCVQCGECRGVCPVFEALPREKYTARGKLALTEAVLRGDLALTGGYRQVVEHCLLCLACVENCGGGVRLDRVVTAARAALAAAEGLGPVKSAALRLLTARQGVVDQIVRGGSLAQYLLFRRIPRTSGLKLRWPSPSTDTRRRFPPLVHTPFRKRVRHAPAPREVRQSVLFFSGCLINYVYPGIGESMLRVLARLGVRTVVPRGQKCCGAPAETSGDLQTVRKLARANIDLLAADGRPVIVACASGGWMLKKVYPTLFPATSAYHARARQVASKTLDIAEFLADRIGVDAVARRTGAIPPIRVTYHDPCHLRRGQGIFEQPRRLLGSIFGHRFGEMPDADRCCGSGGTYSLAHWDVSRRIMALKTENILKTSAAVVATGCPGCMIQLKDGLARTKEPVRVMHIVELIDAAMMPDD